MRLVWTVGVVSKTLSEAETHSPGPLLSLTKFSMLTIENKCLVDVETIP